MTFIYAWSAKANNNSFLLMQLAAKEKSLLVATLWATALGLQMWLQLLNTLVYPSLHSWGGTNPHLGPAKWVTQHQGYFSPYKQWLAGLGKPPFIFIWLKCSPAGNTYALANCHNLAFCRFKQSQQTRLNEVCPSTSKQFKGEKSESSSKTMSALGVNYSSCII